MVDIWFRFTLYILVRSRIFSMAKMHNNKFNCCPLSYPNLALFFVSVVTFIFINDRGDNETLTKTFYVRNLRNLDGKLLHLSKLCLVLLQVSFLDKNFEVATSLNTCSIHVTVLETQLHLYQHRPSIFYALATYTTRTLLF